MIQEYLLNDPAERVKIRAYKPKNIRKRMFSVDKGRRCYVQFSQKGDNEDVAKQLSSVDVYVRDTFNVTVLENGCSAYFCKRLFPLVSEFEYKLRKLLYLTSVINHEGNSGANIEDLESKELGQIFSLLFVDSIFMSKVKEEVKSINRDYYSKANVIAIIEAIDENLLWDQLLGKDSVSTLRSRFNDVRAYRNDVMHFHHISWKQYRAIWALYKSINNELEEAIHDIDVMESKTPSKPTFNLILEEALRTQEQLSSLANEVTQSTDEIRQLAELLIKGPALIKAMKRVNEYSSVYMPSPEQKMALEQLTQLSKGYQSSSAILDLQEHYKNIAKLKADIPPLIKQLHEMAGIMKVQRIEIPPEMLRLQSNLASIQIKDEDGEIDETGDLIKPSDNDNDGGKN